MGTLTEYLKDKAAKLRAEKPERERLIEDWRSALDRLLDQLEQWVREADTERTVTLGAINGALQARHSARRSAGAGAKQLRRALQHLVAS